jgi:hypothetical protein
MAPKNKKTSPKEKETEKVDRKKGKVVTYVRPDTVPNCLPDRNLFLEALGIPSTNSTSLMSSQTPSPQPQRNQSTSSARSEPRANQPRESTKTTLFPYGHHNTRSKSTRGSARKAPEGKAEQTSSPQPRECQRSLLQAQRASPQNQSLRGKSTNNRGGQKKEQDSKRKRKTCSTNGAMRLKRVTPSPTSRLGQRKGRGTSECSPNGAKGCSHQRALLAR